ncbi:MAG TPA: hypothetical protein VMF69_12505 [Gemmataceae bacterium]|nr:hypothetical protein [Gemmataceae bacterium]
MASPFQRQALYRKLTYAALILGLLTVALGWRKGKMNLFGMAVKGVDAQASDLSIREQSRGEVDWLSALARLSTIGTRGLATCVLWVNAMDAQKKNQWNELELYARSLTKLQPHFITPWIFQSWNLSYNVSVESDRVNDKYFYITRGIGLLAEGERQNRDNPDIRQQIGFFTQHKICQSDETNVLRSLSQLSMIPPNERDPGRFLKVGEGSRQEINFLELEDFCKLHPQLVRRLHEGIKRDRRSEQLRQFRCARAEDMVQFLKDNFRVPSLWIDPQDSSAPGAWKQRQDALKPLADRFPVLPPKPDTRLVDSRPYQEPPDETALHDQSQLLDAHDAYQIARTWYSYAQEPLPMPGKLPGQNEPIVNRVYQRLNKHMMTIIFRSQPGQAQRFTAERLQDEGWFDNSGWAISEWFRDADNSFADGSPAAVGGGKRPLGLDAWVLALRDWTKFGKDNHLLTEPAEQRNLEQRAQAFAKKRHLRDIYQNPNLREDELDAETQEEYFAILFLRDLAQHKQVCNFDVHYNRAQVESQPETVQARKLFFEALAAQRQKNDERGALRKYLDPACMKAWRDKVLMSNKAFRNETLIQEQTFEIQLRYIDLYSRLGGRTFKANVARMLLMPTQNAPGGGVCPLGLVSWVPPLLIENNWDNPLLGGPFDGSDAEGRPLIPELARRQVLQRLFPSLYAASSQQPR